MHAAIVQSSNIYYYSLANDMGVDAIHDFMKPLGFGQITGIDILGEVRGLLPSHGLEARRLQASPSSRSGTPGETISLGIGQGYNSFTMLQLAQATATLANNGIKHQPHLVQRDRRTRSRARGRSRCSEPPADDLGFKPEQHRRGPQCDGRRERRTAPSARVFAGAPYTLGGKTGTAQAVGDQARTRSTTPAQLEEHQRDHALFMAFAPADEPKIAIAVIVENAGFGAAHAAPIARRVFDYWLVDQYPNEQDMAAVQTGKAGRHRQAARGERDGLAHRFRSGHGALTVPSRFAG